MTNDSRYSSVQCSIFLIAVIAAAGCRSKAPPPEPEAQPAATTEETRPAASTPAASSIVASTASAGAVSSGSAADAGAKAPIAVPSGAVAVGDPLQGKFSLDDALKGLPKTGKLIADLVTDAGSLKCELYDDKAPNTVANFVGLARGLRPFKDPKRGTWEKRPAYDGGVFHRIIKGFMIQGGDPTGTGAGDGGYVIPDEVWPGASHDRRGLLCMANRGKNTNSMQFFILDGAAPHLDGGYTIFGSCGPHAVLEKLASSEVRGDRAITPPKITKVTVRRGK